MEMRRANEQLRKENAQLKQEMSRLAAEMAETRKLASSPPLAQPAPTPVAMDTSEALHRPSGTKRRAVENPQEEEAVNLLSELKVSFVNMQATLAKIQEAVASPKMGLGALSERISKSSVKCYMLGIVFVVMALSGMLLYHAFGAEKAGDTMPVACVTGENTKESVVPEDGVCDYLVYAHVTLDESNSHFVGTSRHGFLESRQAELGDPVPAVGEPARQRRLSFSSSGTKPARPGCWAVIAPLVSVVTALPVTTFVTRNLTESN
ncbi:hypothetical protein MRX96_053556 [Rhipicephalus microplus]